MQQQRGGFLKHFYHCKGQPANRSEFHCYVFFKTIPISHRCTELKEREWKKVFLLSINDKRWPISYGFELTGQVFIID